MVFVALLGLAAAAKRLGVASVTLRAWADQGHVPFVWVGKSQLERWFEESAVDAFLGVSAPVRARVEVACVRVSGAAGRETSLAAQEEESPSRVRGGDRRGLQGQGRRVTVEVLHPEGSAGGMGGLLAGFMSLIVAFAGRLCGIRSRQACRRLLDAAVAGTVVGDPGGVGA